MSALVGFLIGCMAGGCIGFTAMAVVVVGREERRTECRDGGVADERD